MMRALTLLNLQWVPTVAGFTVLEAWRSRLFAWAALGALLVACTHPFLAELAQTDVARLKAGLLGGPLRMMAVFAVSALVVSAMVRELNDKVTELVLAMAVPRHQFFLGKLAGYMLCSLGMALIFALPVLPLFQAPDLDAWVAWAGWTTSLALELSLVAGVALLAVLTFGHMALAMGATFAMVLMSRLLADVQLIARTGMHGDASGRAADGLLWVLGLVLPRLDLFTQTEWLISGVDAAALGALAGQVALYLGLLAAVGLWDLHRREW
jgi:hypothetical protein